MIDALTGTSPVPETVHHLPGLAGEVEILLDRWGVPHIYAQTRADAFFAQGFAAARDRLFQIDLWRRRGLGQLAEVLGPRYTAQDRATRLFLYRGDMRAEWLSYSTDAQDVVTSFVAGVNAFVGWAEEAPEERMPPEFAVLGYGPARWNPEDVVRIRTHGLLYNAEQELARALTTRELGAQLEELRAVRESEAPSQVDADVVEHLTDAVLDTYRLAFAPVDFTPLAQPAPTVPSGSNNWVVAPSRTSTGRPVLANDPHRAVTLPSLRYIAHLEAPGLSVVGAGEPHLPGISIGHNGRVAFGLTIWAVDHEDLYVYELHPEDDRRYRYNDGWEVMDVVVESSAVHGGQDVDHQLLYTRHGPVVHVDLQARQAVAVRAVWLQPGMVPYLGSLEYQDAANAEEFRRALRRWGAPGVNQVYATTDGDIGWQAAALVPRRPGWDGSAPVPGDGRFEWDGFAPVEELPSVHNPESGWFSSSNENNLPGTFDNEALTTTTDWYSTARHERLSELLDAEQSIDVTTSTAMQHDALNLHGRRLVAAIARRLAADADLPEEWHRLVAWDGVEAKGSREALVFQVWVRRHLRPWLVDAAMSAALVSAEAHADARRRLLRADTLFSDLRPDLRMVELFRPDVAADQQALRDGVTRTLATATADITDLLGPDQSRWTWGELHQTTLRHAVLGGPLGARAGVPVEWGALPAVPRDGSCDTVGLTGYDVSFNAVMGSSFRIAVDVGGWDATQVMNSPGQSGDPRSTHYTDHVDLWARGGSFPLLYSREAVEGAMESRTVLVPAERAGEEGTAPASVGR